MLVVGKTVLQQL